GAVVADDAEPLAVVDVEADAFQGVDDRLGRAGPARDFADDRVLDRGTRPPAEAEGQVNGFHPYALHDCGPPHRGKISRCSSRDTVQTAAATTTDTNRPAKAKSPRAGTELWISGSRTRLRSAARGLQWRRNSRPAVLSRLGGYITGVRNISI